MTRRLQMSYLCFWIFHEVSTKIRQTILESRCSVFFLLLQELYTQEVKLLSLTFTHSSFVIITYFDTKDWKIKRLMSKSD